MRALTIRQPHADAIVHLVENPKRTENRTRPTKYRGLLLIHAGLTGDRAAVLAGIPVGPDRRGHIIGTAQLVGCHPGTGCCAPWGRMQASRSEPPVWHWELADVQALTMPVPAKGQLGLWNPPAEVLAAVRDQPCPVCSAADDCHQLGCSQDTGPTARTEGTVMEPGIEDTIAELLDVLDDETDGRAREMLGAAREALRTADTGTAHARLDEAIAALQPYAPHLDDTKYYSSGPRLKEQQMPIEPGQVYRSCDPRGGPRVRVVAVNPNSADVVDARDGKRPRRILLNALHASPITKTGKPRRTGYALETT